MHSSRPERGSAISRSKSAEAISTSCAFGAIRSLHRTSETCGGCIPTIFLTGRKLGSNLLKREKYAEPGAPGGRHPGVKNAPLTRLSWCLMIPEHARCIHPAPVTHCRCLTPFCTLNALARNSPGNQSASELSCNILVTKDTHNGGG